MSDKSTIGAAVDWAKEKVNEMTSQASYESNKEKAKNPNNTAGERVGGAIDAVKDKGSEMGHKANKEVNKQQATH